MWRHRTSYGASAIFFLLKTSRSLPFCQSVQTLLVKSGLDHDIFIKTAIVISFSRFGDVRTAYRVFEEMPYRDAGCWNAMLSGLYRNGYIENALNLFDNMLTHGQVPNCATLSILLQLCSDVEQCKLGKSIHGYIYRRKIGHDDEYVFLLNSVMDFYNKMGCIDVSKLLFDRMVCKNLISWNVMCSGYVSNGFPRETLLLIQRLQAEGFFPDIVTMEVGLRACSLLGNASEEGRIIHGFISKSNFCHNVYVENNLLVMYSKCGCIKYAEQLFNEMKIRNLVSWNVLINAYTDSGDFHNAISLFKWLRIMQRNLNSDVLVSFLRAIKLLGEFSELVLSVHCIIIRTGFESDPFVSSSLVSAYGQCSSINAARKCFDHFIIKQNYMNVRIWNVMLSLYACCEYIDEAIELFGAMVFSGCKPDSVTLIKLFQVFSSCLDWRNGKSIHGYVIRNHFESNVRVTTSMIEFYIQFRMLASACFLFSKMPYKNIVSWNTMIFGCCQNGFPRVSLNLFHLMQEQCGLIPDATTVVGTIHAISQRGYEREGEFIHEFVKQSLLNENEFVVTALIKMYCGFRDFDKAYSVFSQVTKLGSIIWNTMISEFSRHRLLGQAMSIFHLMKVEGRWVDNITLLSLLSVCSQLASLQCGMWVHSIIFKIGLEFDVCVQTSLIDLYAKCGDQYMAQLVFERMPLKTAVTWNAMIWCHAMHGNVNEACDNFLKMQKAGLFPDIVTFLGIIFACSHGGDVNKGVQYFDLMIRVHSLTPTEEQFSCLIDLFGRGGLISEAFEFLEKIPASLNHAWGSLLSACRVRGNIEFGLLAANKLLSLDPLHRGYYILLSNLYCDLGRWMDSENIKGKFKEMELKKLPGKSLVECGSGRTLSEQ